jgi:hypothetical protein
MTMREFMNMKKSDDKEQVISAVMLKVIEKVEEEANRGVIHCYNPSNIFLKNLNPRNLNALSVTFGVPITIKKSKVDGLYLAPEVLKGDEITLKSIVFSLAVIWDELFHGSNYYKTVSEIENIACTPFVTQLSTR